MKNTISILMATLLAVTVTECREKAVESVPESPFCLTDTLQKKISIDTVKTEVVRNTISLSGKIEANADKWVKVFPVVGGVVEELKVQLGDHVTRGQTLAVIHSSEIADLQGQLSFARSTLKIQEKNRNDMKEMYTAGLATQKDVLAAETDLEKAKADLARLQQSNFIYGAKGNAIQTITAPVSGYIIEKNVTDKMQFKVDGALPFFTIANLDEVWVMASVFESDIEKIKTGYDADIRVLAYNDKVFTGKIDRIFSILDPQSRVMKVRIRIPNPGNLLKPEMFAQIQISYEDSDNKLPRIPSEAVIFDKNKNFVMVYNDKCHIETRDVEVFETIGHSSYIRNGLKEGEKVISRCQLLVYDALNN